MKKLLALLTSALLLILPACGGDDPHAAVLGRYDCVAVAQGRVAIAGMGEYIELSQDGAGRLSLSGVPMEGSWSLAGSDFALTVQNEQGETAYDLAGQLQGEVLTVEIEGYTCTFVKAG
ncbi:MAG: hypothetical protein IJC43_06340 [Clostridia bacterium]|nr:hypothetical protein [Clostridia bacterium]